MSVVRACFPSIGGGPVARKRHLCGGCHSYSIFSFTCKRALFCQAFDEALTDSPTEFDDKCHALLAKRTGRLFLQDRPSCEGR